LLANDPQRYQFQVPEAISSKVDASNDWKSELGRALAKKVQLAKELAIACDPDYRIVF